MINNTFFVFKKSISIKSSQYFVKFTSAILENKLVNKTYIYNYIFNHANYPACVQ